VGTSQSNSFDRPAPVFATTHWSVVLTAAGNDTTRALAALERLCRTYWYPLYAYGRRRGHTAHDAQDLTQAFFARLLEHQSLSSANPCLGRFRSFMLTAMNRFITSEWKKEMAQKRGGGLMAFSLDWAAAERRFDLDPATHASPDKIFEKEEKQWKGVGPGKRMTKPVSRDRPLRVGYRRAPERFGAGFDRFGFRRIPVLFVSDRTKRPPKHTPIIPATRLIA
jgi:hypothetical protein